MDQPVPLTADVIAEGDAEPLPWARALQAVVDATFCWISTIREPHAPPHTRPALVVVVDGILFSTSRPGAVKARNVSAEPVASVAARDDDVDVVVEATVRRITDRPTLELVAAAYADTYNWPVTIEDDAYLAPYGAPTAGDPPYQLFAFTPVRAYAFGTNEEHAPRSTRWTF